jgi:DNA-directed RNA polymerase subunit RPC12/RpoP
MNVRCGRCGSGFEVPDPGRHACPVCGTVNEVRPAPVGAAPPPPRQEQPSPRVSCGNCGFSFIVGAVDEAPCPNCGTRVPVGRAEGGAG